MQVALIHPDLGLGGAERLVIDVAVALKARGYKPTIYTAFRDPLRCFTDVVPGREVIEVRVRGVPLPRSLAGRCHALLAALRCCAVALYVCLFARPDVAIVDVVSLPVVVFALFRVPVVFYCHFPDKRLEESLRSDPKPVLRRAYRAVVDGLEEGALRRATRVVCNSRFTQDVYCATYPSLGRPSIVYPCVHLSQAAEGESSSSVKLPSGTVDRGTYFLSLNRYERKKNIPLAIAAFSAALESLGTDADPSLTLVIAGGFDARLPENGEHFAELEELVVANGLQNRVYLLQNVSDDDRARLMTGAIAIIYTPHEEHFGIVPLEAMSVGTPVVAANSGGPVETVVDSVTGRLCEPTAAEFGAAMAGLARDPVCARKMGSAGSQRVRDNFSMNSLGAAMSALLEECKA
jgi:alpha-1,3/alpha-1,6-mannosyltransferase